MSPEAALLAERQARTSQWLPQQMPLAQTCTRGSAGRQGYLPAGRRQGATITGRRCHAAFCASAAQISQLGSGVRQARAQSSVELLGRKILAGDSDQEAAERLLVSPADPAARILEALLSEPDQAARFAMLPDAFKPPDPQQQVPCQLSDLLAACIGLSSCRKAM